MKARVIQFVAFLLVSSAVTVASAQPAAETPTGVWEGIITGREMATSNHVMAQNVRLVIRDDATWLMTTATWQASGTVLTRGGRLVLEGRFITGNPGRPAGRALYDLSLWGNQSLGGSGSAQFSGAHITTGVQLKKVQ